jgi:protein involved in sex pheromone biosynthesis
MKKHIALGLVASTLFLAGCCTTHHVTRWEYEEVRSLEQVNKAAADGWTVVDFSAHTRTDVYSSGTTYNEVQTYLLKRPKQ